MTQSELYTACGVVLLAIGLIGFLTRPDFIRKILALNVIGISIFMLLIATAVFDINIIDPVPHAMVLTGIVVAAAGTALGLNLASKITKLNKSARAQDNLPSVSSIKSSENLSTENQPNASPQNKGESLK